MNESTVRPPIAVATRRDVVRAHGPQAASFLQGQLSQDVEGLVDGGSAPAFLLQPQGKVVAWLRVTRRADDDLILDVDAGGGDAVLARLARFKLRTAVDLELSTWDAVALRGPGAAQAGAALAAASGDAVAVPVAAPGGVAPDAVDVLGARLAGGAPDGFDVAGDDALEAWRIAAGVPALGREVDESTIPAELGQWAVDASVSFTKGCYTGQELVARIDSRGGNVPRPVRRLVVDGDGDAGSPTPADLVGAELLVDGPEAKVVGILTSAASAPGSGGVVALGVVARSAGPGSTVAVRAAGTTDATPLLHAVVQSVDRPDDEAG